MHSKKLNTMSLKKDTSIFVLPENGYICTLFLCPFLRMRKGRKNDI